MPEWPLVQDDPTEDRGQRSERISMAAGFKLKGGAGMEALVAEAQKHKLDVSQCGAGAL